MKLQNGDNFYILVKCQESKKTVEKIICSPCLILYAAIIDNQIHHALYFL